MRVKKVNRYWCEFCNKAGLSAGHMRKHESRCTLNPLRDCGVCKLIEAKTTSVADLVKLLPDPSSYREIHDFGVTEISRHISAAVSDVLPSLREAAHDCPACIMAAIRQRGIPMPMVEDFNFTEEMQKVWANVNERNYSQQNCA